MNEMANQGEGGRRSRTAEAPLTASKAQSGGTCRSLAIFNVGDRFYSGKVNIKILNKKNDAGENLRLMHDITDIKDITDEVGSLSGARPKEASSIGEDGGIVAQDGGESQPPVRWSIAGSKAINPYDKATAEEMERKGASRESIFDKVGLWRGKDGNWRVELPDITNATVANLRKLKDDKASPTNKAGTNIRICLFFTVFVSCLCFAYRTGFCRPSAVSHSHG